MSQTVFVVDDESIIARTLATILNQTGLHAVPFDRPAAALQAVSETAPDLLITDVIMPGMTGIELARAVRQQRPACKVLLFSGQAATANLLQEAKEQGEFFEILLKPVHPGDLIAKLSRL